MVQKQNFLLVILHSYRQAVIVESFLLITSTTSFYLVSSVLSKARLALVLDVVNIFILCHLGLALHLHLIQ